MDHVELKPRHMTEVETKEQRIRRKAAQIRRALIATGAVYSPDAETLFEELPEKRQTKWLHIATAYCEVM